MFPTGATDPVETVKLYKMAEAFLKQTKLEWAIKESSSRNITVTLQRGIVQAQERRPPLSTIKVTALAEMAMCSRIMEASEWSTM